MTYKFTAKNPNDVSVSLELGSHCNMLSIGASEDDAGEGGYKHYVFSYIEKNEIDNLIIALTAIKNEITEFERSV